LFGLVLLAGVSAAAIAVILVAGSGHDSGSRSDVQRIGPADAVARSDGAILFTSARSNPLGDGELYAINADGRGVKTLGDSPTNIYLLQRVWSPDTKRFAFASAGGLSVADADGRNERLLVEDRHGYIRSVTWSRQGDRIAYSSDEQNPLSPKIYVVPVAGGQANAIADGAYPAWSPTADSIAFVREGTYGQGLFLMNADGSDQRRLWPPAGANRTTSLGEGTPRWSPDGRQLAYWTYSGYLAVINADGTGARTLHRDSLGDSENFQWSPTSAVIAFSTYSGQAFIVEPGNRRLVRIAAGLGKVGSAPSWSPDGTKLALSINGDLWLIAPGADRRTPVLNARAFGAEVLRPQWEAGGRKTRDLGGRPVEKYLSVRVKADTYSGILRTSGVVGALSADGGKVALRVGSECPHVEIWERDQETVAKFPVTYDCASSAGAGISEVVLSRGRAAWIQYQESNHLYLDVVTATPQRPSQDVVFGATDQDAGHLRASGTLFVFASWTPDGPVGSNTMTTLWRLNGARASRLASGTNVLAPMAVDGDRIVVSRGGGRFEVLKADGRRLRTMKLHDDVRALAYAGDDLVALREDRLDWLTGAGRLRRSWPTAARGARLEGVEAGIAVYVAQRRIHLLRLRDGRRVTLNPPGRGEVHADLDRTGLFYAYAVGEGRQNGRVAFLAFPKVRLRFR
jgi:Tol biopolymer transport system component